MASERITEAQGIPPFIELDDSNTEKAKGWLMQVFGKNLEVFLRGEVDEQTLIFIKFIERRNLVSLTSAEYRYGFEYGDLKDKFISLFKDQQSNTFPPVTFSDEELMPPKEKLPKGYEEIAGKRVFRTITNYPLLLPSGGSEGMVITQDEFRDQTLPLRIGKRIETWRGRKVNFSQPISREGSTAKQLTLPHSSHILVTA